MFLLNHSKVLQKPVWLFPQPQAAETCLWAFWNLQLPVHYNHSVKPRGLDQLLCSYTTNTHAAAPALHQGAVQRRSFRLPVCLQAATFCFLASGNISWGKCFVWNLFCVFLLVVMKQISCRKQNKQSIMKTWCHFGSPWTQEFPSLSKENSKKPGSVWGSFSFQINIFPD